MNTSAQSLVTSIDTLTEAFIAKTKQTTGKLPVVEQDTDWPSPCEIGEVDSEGLIQWQPCKITDELGFENVEQAIGYSLHEDINTFFCHCYAEPIPASCDVGDLELLFAWSKDDFERLQQNIIGHLLMKKRLKQEPTIFFAITDEDDINLVIKNDTGEVWVEPVGCEPKTFIANNLAEFLGTLTIK